MLLQWQKWLKQEANVATRPNKSMTKRETGPSRTKNVPRETIQVNKPTFVYRKDAFKKVKIT